MAIIRREDGSIIGEISSTGIAPSTPSGGGGTTLNPDTGTGGDMDVTDKDFPAYNPVEGAIYYIDTSDYSVHLNQNEDGTLLAWVDDSGMLDGYCDEYIEAMMIVPKGCRYVNGDTVIDGLYTCLTDDSDELEELQAAYEQAEANGNVMGVRGEKERRYRYGRVTLTCEDIGAVSIDDIGSLTGGTPVDHTHPDATESASGFMSAPDKQKLNKLDPNQPGGTVTSLNPGLFRLYVANDGHLMMAFNDNDPTPPLSIQDGKLVYTIS